MRILYAVHRIPYPPDKGDKIRSYHFLRGLCKNHEVDLVTLADRVSDLEHIPLLEKMCEQVRCRRLSPRWSTIDSILAVIGKGPLSVRYFHHRGLMKDVEQLIANHSYDVGIAFSSTMYPYLANLGCPKVLDMVDVDSEKFRLYGEAKDSRLWRVWSLEAKRLRAFESRAVSEADLTLLATENERDLCRSLMAGKRIEALENGVDLDAFSYAFPNSQRPSAVFVGAMDYKPNIEGALWFAKSVFPKIKDKVPDFEWTILGREPAASLRELDNAKDIHVTGTVPDVLPYLRRSSISVAPLRVAQGIQNKVLESLAAGIPVVATEEAARGLDVTYGKHLEVANDAEEMASTIIRLLNDQAHAQRLSQSGRKLVEERYGWDASHEKLESLLQTLNDATESNSVART